VLLLAAAAVLGVPGRASAQDQVFTIAGGFFNVEGADARSDGDVLFANLPYLAFEVDDFNGGFIGADWGMGVGNFVEVGVGAGYYQRTVPSVYREFIDEDGTEIYQDLKLRMVPITATARLFPLGRRIPVQPYVGGGVAFIPWRYTETGEFIDFVDPDNPFDDEIFFGTFKDSGWGVGPVFVGGLRFAGDPFLGGFEFRYQNATADLDRSAGFVEEATEIDLGAYSFLFTFGWRF
jgi:hypothetical protein